MRANNIYAFFGRQGSGKSTQAKLLADKLHLPYFNTGNELRVVSQENSELGQEVKKIMQQGALVDSKIICRLFDSFLEDNDISRGIVTDGFPRNDQQYRYLKKIAHQKGMAVVAIEVDIDENTAYERIRSRVIIVAGKKVMREDDRPEIVKQRLANYQNETVPLLARFKSDFVLYTVDGMPSIEIVFDNVLEALGINNE